MINGTITGIILPSPYGEPGNVLSGFITGDTKGRFRDGQFINSSLIMEGPDEQGIVKTYYSSYKFVEGSIDGYS